MDRILLKRCHPLLPILHFSFGYTNITIPQMEKYKCNDTNHLHMRAVTSQDKRPQITHVFNIGGHPVLSDSYLHLLTTIHFHKTFYFLKIRLDRAVQETIAFHCLKTYQ